MIDYTKEDLRLGKRMARRLGFDEDGECACRDYPECACRHEFSAAANTLAAFRAEARQSEREACERVRLEEREACERIVEECGEVNADWENCSREILRRLRERAK